VSFFTGFCGLAGFGAGFAAAGFGFAGCASAVP